MNAQVFPISTQPVPLVNKQTSSTQIEVSNGGVLTLGTFVLCSGHQVGIVRSHRHGRAVVELCFELTADGRWGGVRTAARIGAQVVALAEDQWLEMLAAIFPSSFEVGRIRQDAIACAARFPDLAQQRAIVCGTTGYGKSSAMMSVICSHRDAVARRGGSPHDRPAMVAFDLHGDFVGRVLEADGSMRPRPNLVQCLEEEPVVLGAGSLSCHVRDLPPSLLVTALGQLSTAQRRWTDRYCIDDTNHDAIEHLIFERYEEKWAELFPDFAPRGEMSVTQIESLKVLRQKMRTLFAQPLFSRDGDGAWKNFFDQVYNGRVVVIDVSSYPEPQRALLVVLVCLAIRRRQEDDQRAKRRLKHITLVVDELHRLPSAYPHFAKLALEGRKFNVGFLLGSQSLGHIPVDVVSMASLAVVMHSEGKDVVDLTKRFPPLKAVAQDLVRLAPGDAYLVASNTPWPLSFAEPAFLPHALKRHVAGAPGGA